MKKAQPRNVREAARWHDDLQKRLIEHNKWAKSAIKQVTVPLLKNNILHVPVHPSSLRLSLVPPHDPDWQSYPRPSFGGWKVSGFMEPHTNFEVLTDRHSSESRAKEFFEECLKQVNAGAFRVVFKGKEVKLSVENGWLADPLRVFHWELRHLLDRTLLELAARAAILILGEDQARLIDMAAALAFNLHARGFFQRGVRPVGEHLQAQIEPRLERLARETQATGKPLIHATTTAQLPDLRIGRKKNRERNTFIIVDHQTLARRARVESLARKANTLTSPILVLAGGVEGPRSWRSSVDAVVVSVRDRYFSIEYPAKSPLIHPKPKPGEKVLAGLYGGKLSFKWNMKKEVANETLD